MNYVKDCWYVAGWASDLTKDKPLALSILNEPIVVWRSASGAVTAFADRCPHRLAPLSLGRCEGEALRCMYHGFLFDRSGAAIEIPGQDTIPPQAKVRSYPVVVQDSWIWVWMGNSQRADTGLIPRAFGFDDERFILGGGYLDYEADASLICDNLLDFSHITYVHANSFGGGASFAQEQPNLRKLDRGLRISRWVENTPGPTSGGRAGEATLIDYWQSYDFVLPGVLIMESGSFEAGSAKRFGADGPPDMGLALRAWAVTSQAVTPMEHGRARYFFSTGCHRDHGVDADRDAMVAVAQMAFGEDKVMIEAQHKAIQASPDAHFVPSAHDRAVTMFNGLVRKLVAAN